MNTPLLLRRAAAFGLDCLLLFVILGPLTFALQKVFVDGPPTGRQLWVCLVMGFSAPAWAYFIVSDRSRRGATVGKRVFGVRVTTQAGDHLSVGRAVGRTALKLLPWELTHLSAFALSAEMNQLTTVQVIGLTASNLLGLTYLVSAVVTGGLRSVHDYAASTQVQLVNESPSCGDEEIKSGQAP